MTIGWWVIVVTLWNHSFVSTEMWMREDQCKAVIQRYMPDGVKARCQETMQPWQQEL